MIKTYKPSRAGFIRILAYGIFFWIFVASCVIASALRSGHLSEPVVRKIAPYLLGAFVSAILASGLSYIAGKSPHGRSAALYTSILFTLTILLIDNFRNFTESNVLFQISSGWFFIALLVQWIIVLAATSVYTWLFHSICKEISRNKL
jgi:hypothetical protein